MFLETEKAKGWPERLKSMKVGNVIPVSISSLSAARQAISRSLPNSGVEMKFETETKEKIVKNKVVKYGEIKRTA
ncbi:hypothetical protein TH53_21815 [Pedobacter lusitanus]|uniref:Uncharacterized protein n=1 Tax=Pedobacter lusitanus TaxID=1503925 RepID=A0A0D0GGI1_9SPHI|nr:hypothetical protein [Pedobacter lusitanus]KIO75250.1 hypothetical protein TH53_21815 [Pedobacter lusitanus]